MLELGKKMKRYTTRGNIILNPAVDRLGYDPQKTFVSRGLPLFCEFATGRIEQFLRHMAAVATPWNGMAIPRRCALPCTTKTTHSTPSNYRI
jgi:hypothetical protein